MSSQIGQGENQTIGKLSQMSRTRTVCIWIDLDDWDRTEESGMICVAIQNFISYVQRRYAKLDSTDSISADFCCLIILKCHQINLLHKLIYRLSHIYMIRASAFHSSQHILVDILGINEICKKNPRPQFLRPKISPSKPVITNDY